MGIVLCRDGDRGWEPCEAGVRKWGGFEEVVEVGGMEVGVVVEEVRCVVCGCPASGEWNDAVGVGAFGL